MHDHCTVCDKEIAWDVDGPVYAFDPPSGTMIGADYCGGCGEPCHNACAGHVCGAELFCPTCTTRYKIAEDDAAAIV